MPTERPSPFTIPEPTFKFAEGPPSEPPPCQSMTVEGLIHNLTVFADFYERASADIESTDAFEKAHVRGGRDANADYMQRSFRATLGIDRLRAYVLARYGEDLTIGTARRVLGDLIRVHKLSVEGAGALSVEAAMDRMDTNDGQERSEGGPIPLRLDRLTQRGETPTLPAGVRNWLTARYLADPTPEQWRRTDDAEPEPIVFVRYEDFAGFLLGAGVDLLPNLDDWKNAGWIEDVMVDLTASPDPDASPPCGVARLNLPLGRHRLVGIRRTAVDAATAPDRRNSEESGAMGELPTCKVPGVVSLNVLRATLEMLGFPDWRKRFESWPEVPFLRLRCAELFPGQPFSSATIELLMAWFQDRGLTPDQARHLPLSEAVRRLSPPSNVANRTDGRTPPPLADVSLDSGTIAAGQGMLAHLDALATANTTVRNWVVELAAKHAGQLTDRTSARADNGGRPVPPAAPPTGTEVGIREEPLAGSAPGWDDLGDAKRAILIVLRRSNERMQGPGIADKAGYKPGTLRHHFGDLQTWNYIDRTKDGYAITPAGAALVPCERV